MASFELGVVDYNSRHENVHLIYFPAVGITLRDIPDSMATTEENPFLVTCILMKECYQEHYKITDIISGEDIPSDGHCTTPCKFRESELQRTKVKSGISSHVNLVEVTLFRFADSVLAFGPCPLCTLHSSNFGKLSLGCEENILWNNEYYLQCPQELHKFSPKTGAVLNSSPCKSQNNVKVEIYPVEVGLNGNIKIGFEKMNPLYFTNSVDYI